MPLLPTQVISNHEKEDGPFAYISGKMGLTPPSMIQQALAPPVVVAAASPLSLREAGSPLEPFGQPFASRPWNGQGLKQRPRPDVVRSSPPIVQW
jgi:hypothetical protein